MFMYWSICLILVASRISYVSVLLERVITNRDKKKDGNGICIYQDLKVYVNAV